MSNEERDSQLSAMFDDELPAGECELLARRLARDEQLRKRWGHYAAIGACIRGERGVRLETPLADLVSAAIKREAVPTDARTSEQSRGVFNPWVTSMGGLAAAAAVAAVAILWMRSTGPGLVAQTSPIQHAVQATAPPPAAPQLAAVHPAAAGRRPSDEAGSYVTPAVVPQGPVLVAPTELANYIVAHSEYSAPLLRRNELSALVAGDSAVPQVTVEPIAVTVVTGK